MVFVIGLLTLIMVLNCFVLIFLVLIQLPKKEAGAGLAFGGAATDALFGAGSGTVLTKVTKYAATGFFVLAFILAILQGRYQARHASDFEKLLAQPTSAGTVTPGPTGSPAPTSTATPAVPLTSETNTIVTPSAEQPSTSSVPNSPQQPANPNGQ